MSKSDHIVHNRKALKPLRRHLRQEATLAEVYLWNAVRRRQLQGQRFRRQHSMGPYILDFYCSEEHLAIEIDGAIHDAPNRRRYDEERTRYLEAQGVRVFRFANHLVLEQLDVVLDAIAWHFREEEE